MLLNFNKCHVGKAEGAVTRSNRVSGLSGRVVWEGFPEEVTLKLRLCRGAGGVSTPQAAMWEVGVYGTAGGEAE